MSLADRTVVITGGGTGIGAGIARALAAEGCRLMLLGRREGPLNETRAACAADDRIDVRTLDVGDRAAVATVFRDLGARWGRLDILVHAAGVNIRTRSMETMTPEQWDEVLRINATGGYNVMYHALPLMRPHRSGLIVNISSISGKRALTLGGVAYCASKFALSALGTTVGNEESKHGIRVTSIYPGEVNTPILDQRPVPVPDERKVQMVQPDDIGAMVAAIAKLPGTAHVPELIIKPLYQEYV
ncbi:MAG TPA: SDR family oxidoreductase [Pirellulaceae bacterium]|nr:SDR family oxidoreductase [Pirellulaceae bacterium]